MPVPITSPLFAETIAARLKLIHNQARCAGCGADRATCRNGMERDRQRHPSIPVSGCCSNCGHGGASTTAAHDALIAEIEAGAVRTVNEANPAPEQGPEKAPMSWLVGQGEWWAPKDSPMLRVVEMTDTHRYHTARWLERNASGIANMLYGRMAWMGHGPLGPSGDMACDAFEQGLSDLLENPIRAVCETELYQALVCGLPTPADATAEDENPWAGIGWNPHADLLRRAEHWSTCPMNRDLAAECECPASDAALYDEPSGRGVGVSL